MSTADEALRCDVMANWNDNYEEPAELSEENSPYFAAGMADGERDTMLNSDHPGGQAIGPDQGKEWSWMYKRGYERGFDPEAFHLECELCENSH
jgi:hypothetical protein